MTFTEQLILTVVDKLLIALIAALVGYWVKGRLERVRREEQAQLARIKREEQAQLARAKREEQFRLLIATTAMPAYQALWSITEAANFSTEADLTTEDRRDFSEELRTWYYAKGNAMFLSWDATDLLLRAKKLLDEGKPSEDVRKAFSDLRTKLKVDMGVYDPEQAKKQLG